MSRCRIYSPEMGSDRPRRTERGADWSDPGRVERDGARLTMLTHRPLLLLHGARELLLVADEIEVPEDLEDQIRARFEEAGRLQSWQQVISSLADQQTQEDEGWKQYEIGAPAYPAAGRRRAASGMSRFSCTHVSTGMSGEAT
jgi:hypothetical protein